MSDFYEQLFQINQSVKTFSLEFRGFPVQKKSIMKTETRHTYDFLLLQSKSPFSLLEF